MGTGIRSPDSESSQFILKGEERELIGKLGGVLLQQVADMPKRAYVDIVERGNGDDGRWWGRHGEILVRKMRGQMGRCCDYAN